MSGKVCCRCGNEKPATLDFFWRHTQKRDGLSPQCKACVNAQRMARYEHKTDARKGVQTPRSEIKRRYRARDPERVRALERAANKRRYEAGYHKQYLARRYREDPGFRLVVLLRTRTRKALVRGGCGKQSTTIELIGCTPDELRFWVESHFAEGMTWENTAEWELDHIKPLAAFDLSDPAQLSAACHYRNIQPLWRSENRRKGAKWKG